MEKKMENEMETGIIEGEWKNGTTFPELNLLP